jgi:hypothetical protein
MAKLRMPVERAGKMLADRIQAGEEVAAKIELAEKTGGYRDWGAAAGRVFIPADDAPGAAPVAVLQYAYWKREFASDRSIIGKTLDLNGLPLTIVGVAEESFAYLTPGNSSPGDGS